MKHHICNLHFEKELSGTLKSPLEQSFRKQFALFLELPSIWAESGDTIYPEKPKPNTSVDSWGPSLLIEDYAKRHNLSYTIPQMDLVSSIQSKAKAHELSPFPKSEILHNEAELKSWMRVVKPPHVFKGLFGFSGLKHFFSPINLPFPVLAESFVTRELDFSSQWYVEKDEIQCLGCCLLLNSPKGKYRGNIVGDEKMLFGNSLPLVQEHKAIVHQFLEGQPSFFGHIGFDAFVYDGKLHPICEINVRKTMGYVALKLFEKYKPRKKLILRFGNNVKGRAVIPEIEKDISSDKNPFSNQLKFDVV